MNRKLLDFVFNDTDPFFIREILIVFIGYISVSAFFSPFTFYSSNTGHFLGSIANAVSIASLLYASIVSGFFARNIEKGSIGHLMTLPINRRNLVIQYILQATFVTSIFFLIPVAFIEYLSLSNLNLYTLAFAFVTSLIFLLLYNSTGFMIASVTKSSVFTTMSVFIFYFLLNGYSNQIDPTSNTVQFMLMGFGYFLDHQSYNFSLIISLIMVLIAGIIVMMMVYPVIYRRGLKNGR
jgi:hypothetical protein